MSHTPGPWGAFGAELEGKVRAEQLLIQPAHQDDSNDFTNIIAELPWQHFTVTEREANARLIAAAPEMLEALEEAIPVLTDAIEDSYCGMHRGRGLCDCKSDIVARISTIIARTKETPNA